MDRVWTDYWDAEGGGLFDTARGRGTGAGLLPAPSQAGAGRADAFAQRRGGIVLARLHELTGDARWRERAWRLLAAVRRPAAELGLHAAAYLLAVTGTSRPPRTW